MSGFMHFQSGRLVVTWLALLAFSCSKTEDKDAESLGSAAQAVTALNFDVALDLPAGAVTNQVAAATEGALSLGSAARVTLGAIDNKSTACIVA